MVHGVSSLVSVCVWVLSVDSLRLQLFFSHSLNETRNTVHCSILFMLDLDAVNECVSVCEQRTSSSFDIFDARLVISEKRMYYNPKHTHTNDPINLECWPIWAAMLFILKMIVWSVPSAIIISLSPPWWKWIFRLSISSSLFSPCRANKTNRKKYLVGSRWLIALKQRLSVDGVNNADDRYQKVNHRSRCNNNT